MLRLPLVAAIAASLLVAIGLPSTASAAYRIGLSEQNAAVFDNPAFQASGVKRVRYILSWDAYRNDYEMDDLELFIAKARQRGAEPFIHLSASRGCWSNNRYKRSKQCRAPSPKRYYRAVKKYRRAFPDVKVWGVWNEANHKSQPTARSPKRAARYADLMRRACKKCTVVGLDVLDQRGMARYVKRFRRHVRRTPRITGLHNYTGVKNNSTRELRQVLKLMPGAVWLTETGGVVKFGSSEYSPKRAATHLKRMFRHANRFDRRRKGYRSRVTRVYVFKWYGEQQGARFDAGLVDPDGTPRPGLEVFLRTADKRSRWL